MDDVSYLRANKATTQESFVFMVDSRMRDRAAHPSPSEYTLEFNAPFRNVCSFSLLDATIPRTHHNVDEDSNILVYSLDGDPEQFTVTLPPGDYTLPQMLDQLNVYLLGGLRADPLTNPYDISNKVVFTRSGGNFSLHFNKSTMRTGLGFGDARTSLSGSAGTQTVSAHAGPYRETQATALSSTVSVRQRFVAQASGTVAGITVASDPATIPSSLLTITATVTTLGGTAVAHGTLSPFRSAEATVAAGAGVLQQNTEYYMVLTASATTQAYISVGAGAGSAQTSTTGGGGAGPTWTDVGEDLQLCFDVAVSSGLFELQSSGLVDLTGEKLVLIRCPEIEQIMFRERYNEKGVHAGLGYCKLGGLGFREQRGDYFIPFPPRTFHPIAKLSKLTFRLEKPDGTRYDARGVDHFLLMVITYYKVSSDAAGGAPTMLHPGYTPDVHAFLNDKWRREAWDQGLSVTSTQRAAGTR